MALQYWTVFNCTYLSSFHVICKNMQMAAPVADSVSCIQSKRSKKRELNVKLNYIIKKDFS